MTSPLATLVGKDKCSGGYLASWGTADRAGSVRASHNSLTSWPSSISSPAVSEAVGRIGASSPEPPFGVHLISTPLTDKSLSGSQTLKARPERKPPDHLESRASKEASHVHDTAESVERHLGLVLAGAG